MKLLKKEQVLVYLYRMRFHKFDEYEVDYELTANGIVDALNISRWYLSNILTELENNGYVLNRYCHVEGYASKFKGYGLTDKGLELAQALESREAITSIEALKAKARGFRHLGRGDWLLTHYDDALIWFQQGLNIVKGKVSDIELSILIDMGNVHNDKQDFKTAIGYYKKGLKLIEAKNIMQSEICRLYNNIGIAYQRMKKYEDAITHFNSSLEQKGTQVDIGHSNVELAYVYALTDRIEEATDHNEKGLKIFKKLNDMNMIVGVYKNRGIIYRQKGNVKKALEWLNKAVELSIQYNYIFNLGELNGLIEETETLTKHKKKGKKKVKGG